MPEWNRSPNTVCHSGNRESLSSEQLSPSFGQIIGGKGLLSNQQLTCKTLWNQARDSDRRAEAFKGLSELCTVAPAAFNSEAASIVDFVLDELLPLQSKQASDTTESDDCRAKVTLAHFYLIV